MFKSRWALILMAAVCALTAPESQAAGVPLGGFVPFVGIGLTRKFQTLDSDPDGTFFIADPEYSWTGTPLGPSGAPYFDLALLDTGAATHILTQAAASNTGFGIHTPFSQEPDGFGGTNHQTIFGANGQIQLLINDPLAVFAAGLAHGGSNGTTLTMTTSFLRGQSSFSTLEAPAAWTLPNVLGLPIASQHAIMIRNDQPLIFQHQGRTVRTPNVELINLGTGSQQGILRRTNLRLHPSASFLQGPFYLQGGNGDIFNLKLHEDPASPSVIDSGGLFVETDLALGTRSVQDKELLFDTGADVTVLSQVMAARLGFDVLTDQPEFVLEVEGAGGVSSGVPGFFLDELNIDTVGGSFTMQNVPVAVLDLPNPNDPANVLDGILGMHLFTGRNLVIDANPAASQSGGDPPRLYISDPVTETHSWATPAASGLWATAGNWNASGTPGALWVANAANFSGSDQTAVVAANSTVHQLKVSGTQAARMTVLVNGGVTLTTFGETLIDVGGRLELAGGKLDTQFVNIQNGGVLTGVGDIFVGTGIIRSPVRNLSGRIEPGAPVGTLTIDGDLSQQAGGTLAIDLGGTSAAQYDRLAVGRLAFLDGILQVSLVNLGAGTFVPAAGNTFTILTAAGGVNGTFGQLLLPNGFQWGVSYGANNVVLTVLSIGGLAGDYNQNGVVDAADYVVWRNSLGATGSGLAADGNGDLVVNQDDFVLWKSRFGTTGGAGAGSGLSANVPEPASGGLLLICLAIFGVSKRRSR